MNPQLTKELTAVAAALNEASNKLAEPINEINGFLKELRIGLATWVNVGPELRLGYIKQEKEWGLYIQERTTDNIWEFNKAPRPYRVECIPELENLLLHIGRNAMKTTTKIRAVTVDVINFVERLKAPDEAR